MLIQVSRPDEHFLILKTVNPIPKIMKKEMPIALWKKVNPIYDSHKEYIIPVKNNSEFPFYFTDLEGKFYFRSKRQDGNSKFHVELNPYTDNLSQPTVFNLDLDNYGTWFERWCRLVADYEDTPTPFDDPILKKYEEEFTTYFEMEDKDADSAPFEFNRQLYVIDYINHIKGLIGPYLENQNEEKAEEVKAIIQECENLENNLPTATKNQVVKGIVKIWAKTRKFSIKLAKDLLMEFQKEGVKLIAKAALDEINLPKIDPWSWI